MKFKSRKIVFNAGRSIAEHLGDIAQNEFDVRETDIIVEFIKVDELINSCQEYKKLLIHQIDPNS